MDQAKITEQFHDMMSNYSLNFAQQIQKVLEIGLDAFQLDIGILSNIEGSIYTVKQCVKPLSMDLSPNQTFEFDSTYCYFTVTSNSVVAIEHVAKDDRLGNHPAYKAFGLESYIGIPIIVKNKIYGTLNFSSPNPFPRKFDQNDIEFMERIGTWIGMRLEHQEL